MPTQLYLRGATSASYPDTHRGTNSTQLDGTAIGWNQRALTAERGTGLESGVTNTVAGPTNGVEFTFTGAFPMEWLSAPVATDVTISGDITMNIWASESGMNANAAINVVIDVIRATDNTIVQIVKSARTTEMGFSGVNTLQNFTATPTSTAVNRGDRIRVRVFADDAGTMGSGFTFSVSVNGATDGAEGDTYIRFTEDFGLEDEPGVYEIGGATDLNFGIIAAVAAYSSSFVARYANLTEVKAWLKKAGTPADNVVLEIQSDSSGPSGVVVGTIATVSGSSLTTTSTQYTYSVSITLSVGTKYWFVARRSGAVDAANNYFTEYQPANSPGATLMVYNGSTWSSSSGDTSIALKLTFSNATTALYLTDTASDVSTASVDKEAWTSRGAGVTNIVTNTTTGWTSPIQCTDSGGGTVVDWFTKRLTAFTLGGMVQANIRAKESSSASMSLRMEIARVDSDGTNATTWGSWCLSPFTNASGGGELSATERAETINVSGDDLAISAGQRLRIRLFADDTSNAAIAASSSLTVYYNGTSGGASGDSYVTFPMTLTEFTEAAPTAAPSTPYSTLSWIG